MKAEHSTDKPYVPQKKKKKKKKKQKKTKKKKTKQKTELGKSFFLKSWHL